MYAGTGRSGERPLPAGLPPERRVDELLERRAVEQVLQRPSVGRVRDDEHPLPVVVTPHVVEEGRRRLDDLAVALAAAGKRHLDMREPDALELGHRAAVEAAVVALTQPGVDPQYDGAVAVGQLGRLERTREVRGVDGRETVRGPSLAQLDREAASLIGESPGTPAGRDALLVVLGDRVGLVDQLDGHAPSWAPPRGNRTPQSCRDWATRLPAESQIMASSSIMPPPRVSLPSVTCSQPGSGRRRTCPVNSSVGVQPRRPRSNATGGRASSAIMSIVVSGSRPSRSRSQPRMAPRIEGLPSAHPAVLGSRRRSRRSRNFALARKSGGACSAETHCSGGGISGGLAWRCTSRSVRLPNEPMARIRSTGRPSSPVWWIVICPVESFRPHRITSVVTVNGPGCEAVMKYADSTTGSTCSVVSVGSEARCSPSARRAVVMTRPPLTALPIIHSSWKVPCRCVGSSPVSSRVASSYSLTDKV